MRSTVGFCSAIAIGLSIASASLAGTTNTSNQYVPPAPPHSRSGAQPNQSPAQAARPHTVPSGGPSYSDPATNPMMQYPSYSGQSYGAPPTYSTPSYSTPPSYSVSPSHSAPPTYSTSTYSTPPAYSTSSYSTPRTYAAPSYSDPATNPMMRYPSYSNQGYAAPPTYSTPAYNSPPAYQEPSYAPAPAYSNSSYGPAGKYSAQPYPSTAANPSYGTSSPQVSVQSTYVPAEVPKQSGVNSAHGANPGPTQANYSSPVTGSGNLKGSGTQLLPVLQPSNGVSNSTAALSFLASFNPKSYGIPADWEAIPTADIPGGPPNGGLLFKSPNNPGTSIRVMPGDSSNTYPNSQAPYVRIQQNGVDVDLQGNPVPAASDAAHIPLEQFEMPEFLLF